MIDVGNDREFGFLYQPELERARSRLRRLLTAELPTRGATPGPPARRASSSCRAGREDPSIQTAVLQRLSDPEPEVREAARAIVADETSIPTAPRTTPSASP